MVPAMPPSMLEKLFGRRRAHPREQEPADLGTAFGMEQTLDQPEWDGSGAEPPYPWLPGSRPAAR
jgi:hypothetical protein